MSPLPSLLGIAAVVLAPAIADRQVEPHSLREIANRVSDADYRYCQYDQHGRPVDAITVAHECTHMLNASLSKPGYHGLYLGAGYGVRVKIPENFRMSMVRVPKEEQTSRYKIYLVDARKWWDSDPLILADEALAYLAGARVRRELGWEKRGETIRNGLELLEFYRKAVEVVKRCDPDYDISAMEAVLVYLDESWSEFRSELK